MITVMNILSFRITLDVRFHQCHLHSMTCVLSTNLQHFHFVIHLPDVVRQTGKHVAATMLDVLSRWDRKFSIPGMRKRKFSISGMMRYLPRRIGTTFSPTYPSPPTMITDATSLISSTDIASTKISSGKTPVATCWTIKCRLL